MHARVFCQIGIQSTDQTSGSRTSSWGNIRGFGQGPRGNQRQPVPTERKEYRFTAKKKENSSRHGKREKAHQDINDRQRINRRIISSMSEESQSPLHNRGNTAYGDARREESNWRLTNQSFSWRRSNREASVTEFVKHDFDTKGGLHAWMSCRTRLCGGGESMLSTRLRFTSLMRHRPIKSMLQPIPQNCWLCAFMHPFRSPAVLITLPYSVNLT